MTTGKHISDSAFLVNESRARNVSLSRDRFAALWVSETTRALWEDFSREVYPLDDVELSLRNRFYLDVLEKALEENPNTVFINLAAGFTSYPFLTERPCRVVEVDFDHVCDYKRARIEAFRKEGLVPERDVEFVACDLRSAAALERLSARLEDELGGARSVAALEGITYYLSRDAFLDVFDMLRKVQSTGSRVALDFWTPDAASHPVHIRFKSFCAARFGHAETDYTLFDAAFLRSIRGFAVVDLTDIVSLEKRFSEDKKLVDFERILPEHYAVLERRRERR
jgi:O-methyltransferase involved in polyketide biosynthesis